MQEGTESNIHVCCGHHNCASVTERKVAGTVQ